MKKIKFPELAGEMAKHGESQRDIAKLLGIPFSSVCRRLSGEIQWTIGDVETLCKHYKKGYYELFKKNEE